MLVSTNWVEELSLGKSISVLTDLALHFALNGGVKGKEVAALITARDFKGILEYNLPYKDGDDPLELANVRQALAFFTKLEDLEVGIDKESVAYSKFTEANAKCMEMNTMFRQIQEGSFFLIDPDVNIVLHNARHFISKVLGKAPVVSELDCAFGPGATTSIKRSQAVPMSKMAEVPSCSSSLLASGLLPSVVRSFPHWFSQHETSSEVSIYTVDLGCPVIQGLSAGHPLNGETDDVWNELPGFEKHASPQENDGESREYWVLQDRSTISFSIVPAKLEFVPKSAKTLRSIKTQGTVNTILQNGIGTAMTKRLYARGLDLTDQSRNQRLAMEGSLTGAYSTLDLSSASDTICTELVRFLLPDDWYQLLKATRHTSCTYKGQYIVEHGFSSMGNGYTFPLESLIFWALSREAVRSLGLPPSKVSVYGDDIIVPGPCFSWVSEVLETCGFTINTSKSFSTGPFRESCGADYFKGINIRPYYQEHLVSGQTLFTLYNFLFRAMYDQPILEKVRRLIPTSLRLYGPDGYGDGHLVSYKWMSKLSRKQRDSGYDGGFFETYAFEAREVLSPYPCDYITPLYSIYVSGGEQLNGTVAPNLKERAPTKFNKQGRPTWAAKVDERDRLYSKRKVYTFYRPVG